MARQVVTHLPEFADGTAVVQKSYAGALRDDVWALVRNGLGELVEYRGTRDAPLARRRLSPETDVNALLLQRSLEGFEDLSSPRLPTARFDQKATSRSSSSSYRGRARSPSHAARGSRGGGSRRGGGGSRRRGSRHKRGSRGGGGRFKGVVDPRPWGDRA